MSECVIKIDNIKRDFIVGDETVHALRGVSFDIHKGEFVTIMGASGSGKSTLLNILGCLDTPTSGEYLLDGIPVRTMGKNQRAILRNRKIGFVFQNYNLLAKSTAIENVELPLMYNPEVSRSLVRQYHCRVVYKGARYRHPLHLPSGHLVGFVHKPVSQPDRLKRCRAFCAPPPLHLPVGSAARRSFFDCPLRNSEP